MDKNRFMARMRKATLLYNFPLLDIHTAESPSTQCVKNNVPNLVYFRYIITRVSSMLMTQNLMAQANY